MTITNVGWKDPRTDYGDFVNGQYATDSPSVNAALFNTLCSILTNSIGKFAPRAQDTPDMTIAVSAGVAYFGDTLVAYAGGNSGEMSAPSANPRIDRVYLTNAGVLAITTGSEAASPSAPPLVDGTFPICLVYHRVGSTEINDADDSINSYIYRDDRPIFQSVESIHTQGTDQYLDQGGANQVSAADAKDAVDKKHAESHSAVSHSDISSSGTDIDDAVSKKHEQNKDQYVDYGGSNQASAADIKDAVDKKHVAMGHVRVLFLPHSFGYPATNPAEKTEWVGTNTTRQEARFDDTTEEFVTGGFPLPSNFNASGTVTIMAVGRSLTAAASKNVAFNFRHLPLADSEAMDVAYTAGASGDSATDATQGDLEVHSWNLSSPGWAASDWIDFKFSRNPGATDDLTGDWALRGLVILIPVTG